MPRTPDEIKKGLECRIRSYKDVCDHQCDTCDLRIPAYSIFERYEDALTLIQQLQDENAQLNRCIENMTDKLNAMNDEVAKLQAERDAAVACIGKLTVILKKYPYAATNGCAYEAYMEIKKYIEAMRGVQKEE